MKRLLMTAAACALLMTPAKAQLMLPPAPLTQWQTEMLNLATVGFYVFKCKGMTHLEYAYMMEGTARGLGRAGYEDRLAAANIIKTRVAEMGRDKFCTMADNDADVQAAFKRIKARDGQ